MNEPVDPAALAALAAQIGDAETVEVVRLFVRAAPQRDAALRVPDAEKAARAAHTLRSGARLVGAAALADAAGRLQQAAESGAPGWPQQRDALSGELAVVVRALEEWLQDRG